MHLAKSGVVTIELTRRSVEGFRDREGGGKVRLKCDGYFDMPVLWISVTQIGYPPRPFWSLFTWLFSVGPMTWTQECDIAVKNSLGTALKKANFCFTFFWETRPITTIRLSFYLKNWNPRRITEIKLSTHFGMKAHCSCKLHRIPQLTCVTDWNKW